MGNCVIAADTCDARSKNGELKFFGFAPNAAGMIGSVAIHFHAVPVERLCPTN